MDGRTHKWTNRPSYEDARTHLNTNLPSPLLDAIRYKYVLFYSSFLELTCHSTFHPSLFFHRDLAHIAKTWNEQEIIGSHITARDQSQLEQPKKYHDAVDK